MNMQGFQGLAVLAFLFGIFTTILWLVIGWRAMRAHEKLANSVAWLARQNYKQEQQPNSSGDN